MTRDKLTGVAASVAVYDQRIGRWYGLAKAGIAIIGMGFGLSAFWVAKVGLSGWLFLLSAAVSGGLVLYCLYHACDGLFRRQRASDLLADQVRARLRPVDKALRIAALLLPLLRRTQR